MTFIFCGKLFALDLRSKYPRKLNTCGYWVLINFDYSIQKGLNKANNGLRLTLFKILSVEVLLVLSCIFYAEDIHKILKFLQTINKIKN